MIPLLDRNLFTGGLALCAASKLAKDTGKVFRKKSYWMRTAGLLPGADNFKASSILQSGKMIQLFRQFSGFVAVGFIAVGVHYSILIGLVEVFGIQAVPAALAGYSGGGIVSYLLNRRHVFRSNRPHEEAITRFIAVVTVGFGLTYVFMRLLVQKAGVPYLLAQMMTTGIVLFWNFAAHKMWTFRTGAEAVEQADVRKP
jgi:putative flippase GtrA